MGLFANLFSFLEKKPRSTGKIQAELNALRAANIETTAASNALKRIDAEERKAKEARVKKRAGGMFAKIAAQEERRHEREKARAAKELEKAREEAEKEIAARIRDPEWRFLNEDEWVESPESSNVGSFRFLHKSNELEILYKDGSAYLYSNISEAEAKSLFHAPSRGGWVWDNLRVRKSVYGFKKPYALISAFGKQRNWMKTPKKRLRHGKIGPEGEPYKGWHP